MITPKSLYDILGISQTATATDVKDAYRRKAMRWHPDRNLNNRPEAEVRFKEVGYAYKVLSDPQQRAQYDAYLAAQATTATGGGQQSRQEESFDSSMSQADAAKMFYDQMLDLAFELARRGFKESQILKMLLALDCPENIAKSVTTTVMRSAGRYRKTSEQAHTEAPSSNPSTASTPLTSLETASWEATMPYYAAVIGGVHAAERMSEAEYQRYAAKNTQSNRIAGACLLAMIVGGGVVSVWKPSVGEIIAILGFLGLLLGVAIWGSFTLLPFRREKAIRYYLAAFEGLHTTRGSLPKRKSWNGSLWGFMLGYLWIAYRRMPVIAMIVTIIWSILSYLGYVAKVITADSTGDDTVFTLFQLIVLIAFLIVWIVPGLFAKLIYYKNARYKIRKVISLPVEQALILLRTQGGTSGWSVLGIFIFSVILSLPSVSLQEDAEQKRLAAIATQQQGEAELRKQATEAQMQREFGQVIAEMEARHPELNSNSPYYKQAVVDEAITRMNAYETKKDITPAQALRLAITDMEQEVRIHHIANPLVVVDKNAR